MLVMVRLLLFRKLPMSTNNFQQKKYSVFNDSYEGVLHSQEVFACHASNRLISAVGAVQRQRVLRSQ